MPGLYVTTPHAAILLNIKSDRCYILFSYSHLHSYPGIMVCEAYLPFPKSNIGNRLLSRSIGREVGGGIKNYMFYSILMTR